MLKKLEIDFEFQKKIFRFAKNKKIHFLSSPFDLDSIEFLSKLNFTRRSRACARQSFEHNVIPDVTQ